MSELYKIIENFILKPLHEIPTTVILLLKTNALTLMCNEFSFFKIKIMKYNVPINYYYIGRIHHKLPSLHLQYNNVIK